MNPQKKIRPLRNRKYLDFVKAHPCGVWNCFETDVDPHHIRRMHWGAGMSNKSHDFVCVPRCRKHHVQDCDPGFEAEIIALLKEWIELMENIDPEVLIIDLLIEHIEKGE
jgi:hypothetical protein